MATIRERGPYQWQVQILRKGQSPQSRTFNNKNDAEKWARSIEAEMDRGIFVSRKESETTTLSEALDRYEREISSKKKSHSIEKVYIRTIKKSFLSGRFLAIVRGSDIAKYRDDRLKEVSPTAVRHELTLLSHLFTIARMEWGMENLLNPVSLVSRPRPNAGRDRRLKEGELEREFGDDLVRPVLAESRSISGAVSERVSAWNYSYKSPVRAKAMGDVCEAILKEI